MKHLSRILSALAAAGFIAWSTTLASAQSTTITYGGELRDAGFKADGPYDVRVGVYDAATGGNLIGDLRTNTLDIVDGRFTAKLDFGESVFTGGDRWLEVGVRPAGVGDFNTLSPRQEITSIPHAIKARSATSVTGQIQAGQLTGTISPYNIGTNTIDETMMANNSVRTETLADSAVTADKIEKISRWSRVEIPPNPGDQGFGKYDYGQPIAAVGTNAYLIGAPQTSNGLGVAYLYDTRGFLLTKFLPPPGQGGFGSIVTTMNPDRVIIVGSETNVSSFNWANILNTNGTLVDTFGVSPDGYSYLKITAFGSNNVLIGERGSATLWTWNGSSNMTYITSFNSPDGTNRTDDFGRGATVVDDNRVLVADPYLGDWPDGRVYMYSLTGEHLLTITPPVTSAGRFGHRIAASGRGLFLISDFRGGFNVYLYNTNGTLLRSFISTNSTSLPPSLAWVGSSGFLLGGSGLAPNRVDHYDTNGVLLNSYTNPIPGGTGFGDALAVLGTNQFAVSGNGRVYLYELKKFTPGLIAEGVKDGSVDSPGLADEAVTSNKLAEEAVTTDKVADEAVTTTKLADEAVTSDKISDGTVATNDLDATVLNDTFWRLDGNTNTAAGTHFLGTRDNQPLEFKVNGVRALRMQPSSSPSLVGGHPDNLIDDNNGGSIIGGGGSSGGSENSIGKVAHFSVVAGGIRNVISSNVMESVIGGGYENTIEGALNPSIGYSATIAGGSGNRIESGAWNATISGGTSNTNSADSAVVPGGSQNHAGGDYSFAAGRRAKAIDKGAFVWADSANADFASTSSNQFLIRASGGVGIGTNNPQAQLHVRGTVLADAFVGDGSGLSNVTSTATITNIIADNLLPATLARLNTNQTFTASNGFSGVVNATNSNNKFAGSFTGTHQGDGAGLTNLNFGTTAVPWANLTGVPGGFADGVDNDTTYSAGPGLVLGGTQFSVNFAGSGVANNASRSDHTHDATNITSGTLNDARLSSNVPLRNGTNIFTGTNVFVGVVMATNGGNQFTGQFTGNGAGLTNLNVGSLAGVAYVGSNQTFTASNTFAGVVTATNVANQLRGSFTGTLAGNGVGVTNLNASNLTTGTVPDLRLSANVSLLSSSIDSSEITDGSILNADINAAAGIVDTKLATITTAGKVANSATTATANNAPSTIVARDASGNFAAGNITATFTGNGANLTNLNATQLTSGTVPDAALSNVWKLGGNAGTTPGTQFVGTTDNQALEIKVNNTRAQRFEPTAGTPNLIGGFSGNSAAPGLVGATVGGGGAAGFPNRVTATYGTVAGGLGNAVLGNDSFIGGGIGNTVQTNADRAVISGGRDNSIGTNADNSTIVGGADNAVGLNAQYALAAGRRANANHPGAFVWADSQNADFASSGTNQFLIRAAGGVGIGTNAPVSALHVNGIVTALGFNGPLSPTNIGSGIVSSPVSFTNLGNTFAGNGTGLTNVNAETLDGLNSTAFWKMGGNQLSAGQFLGSTNNQSLEFRANNQRVLVLDPNAKGAPNIIGGSPVNSMLGGVVGSIIAGGGATNEGGFAYTNRIESSYTTISGGADNAILFFATGGVIAGGVNNRINTNAVASVIGGGNNNTIRTNAFTATIAGGGYNYIGATEAFIGGGAVNSNSSQGGVITGGSNNRIESSSGHSTVGGGQYNRIEEFATISTISGGRGNLISASSTAATIGGGESNRIAGLYSTVPGGYKNVALADYSFAAGRRALAKYQGGFVWADSTDEDFSSGGPNQFLIRAGGGVGINTATPGGVLGVDTTVGKVSIVKDDNLVPGLVMTGGDYPGILRLRNSLEIWPDTTATAAGRLDLRNTSGTATITLEGVNGTVSALVFNPPSDRNLKENFQPVNRQAVLEKVAALPMNEWNFRTDTERTRHLGPMAQDFHAAFGLGTDDRHIATVDADGVALAAIQGLNEKLEVRSQRSEDRSRKLEDRLQQKEIEITELKQRLEKLEQLLHHKLNGGAK